MITVYDHTIIGFHLFLMPATGLVFRKMSRNTSDYFRAGGASAWIFSFSAWTFTGAAGKVYETGTLVLVVFPSTIFGLLIAMKWTCARFRRMRVITWMEAVGIRFGPFNEQFYTWIKLPLLLFFAGLGLNAIGVFMAAVFRIDMETMLVVLGTVVTLVAFAGGSWAVLASDFVQAFLIMTITISTAVMVLVRPEIGGLGGLIDKVPHAHFCWTDLALEATRAPAGRYIAKGGYFRAWGRMDETGTEYDGLAIIDCLMNMPLLHWVGRETGDGSFRDMAMRHTDNTMRHFIRPDDSVYHCHRFNRETGLAEKPDNYCGHAVESHWARGNAWAMYGFALAYRHGGSAAHLDASLRVSRKFISCLDDAGVPLWDFRLSPGYPHLRDSSAAAVAVCAIQELEVIGVAEDGLTGAKRRMLAALLSPEYFDPDPAVRGVLRMGEVGDGADAGRRFYHAKHAYTSWGDYFLMEAIARELGHVITWW